MGIVPPKLIHPLLDRPPNHHLEITVQKHEPIQWHTLWPLSFFYDFISALQGFFCIAKHQEIDEPFAPCYDDLPVASYPEQK